jgi:hypothetical protein
MVDLLDLRKVVRDAFKFVVAVAFCMLMHDGANSLAGFEGQQSLKKSLTGSPVK